MKKTLCILIFTLACVCIIHAEVNFQYEFSLYKPDASDHVCNIQLFDYNDDGVEEIFIGYSNENIMKIVCYDLSGDTIITFNDTLASDAEFQKFSVFDMDGENKLITVTNFTSNTNKKKLMLRLYELQTFSLVDSIIYEVPYWTMDGADPLDIKSLLTSWNNMHKFVYIGYIYSYWWDYGIGCDHYYDSYITKFQYVDSFSFIENIIGCGIDLSQLCDSLIASVGYEEDEDHGWEWHYEDRAYFVKTLSNEIISTINNILEIYGGYSYGTDIYSNFPVQLIFISRNNLNSEIYGNLLYYKTLDSGDGTTVIFKNFSYDYSELLWEREDTETGFDDIISSSCVDIYNNEKYIIYFRSNSLEIRDRVNGNIYYHQESSIIPSKILRLNNGTLILLVNRDDETGYDAYTLDGPFFGIDQNNIVVGELLNINYPNPFNLSTTFSFSSKEPIQNAEIKVYNIKGQLVRELRFNASPLSRFLEISWDGKDKNGHKVSPGVYLYQLCIDGEYKAERKCLLIE